MKQAGPGRGPGLSARLEALIQRLWFAPAPGSALQAVGAALTPLSWLTGRIATRRRARINERRRADQAQAQPDRPAVIIVGNLIAGGAGKTPLTLALASHLGSQGWRVGLLCRGGPAGARAAQLVPTTATPTDALTIGDEARLLADLTGLPVAIGHRRALALDLLTRSHPDLQIVISDDGLQHQALRRDLELILLDRRELGNGRLLPAGPLREPAAALETADAIVINRGMSGAPVDLPVATIAPVFDSRLDVRDVIALADYLEQPRTADTAMTRPGLPAASARILRDLSTGPVAAVAGIANPAPFFQWLDSMGLQVTRYAPGDHAPISAAWIDRLPEPAVIMTEKDAVKCRGSNRAHVYVLRIAARPEPGLLTWLNERLEPFRRNINGPTHS